MSVSKIFLFSDKVQAQNKFGQYSKLADNGFNAILIGPTDVFRITGQSPNKIEWASGEENDWYMVIITESVVWTAGEGVQEAPDVSGA